MWVHYLEAKVGYNEHFYKAVTNQVIPITENRVVQGFSMVMTCFPLEQKMDCVDAI